MIYSVKKIDDDIFRTSMVNTGRDVVSYYTNEVDRILVEPNASLDGGKIYCRSDSWIKRGDIIKISNEWYVVSHLSNLASSVYNVGIVTRCDVKLILRLGDFVYEIPAVASKYSGNSNVRGIIDDSVEGKLSFITGYNEKFKKLQDNPCVSLFGKVWQVGDYMNVNNVLTVYCEGVSIQNDAAFCIEPIPMKYKVGDSVDLKIHLLNRGDPTLPDDIEIVLAGPNMGKVEGSKVTFTRAGVTSIAITSNLFGAYYVSKDIEVTE